MVESTPAIPNAEELTEHERRLKRAARFGVEATIGPTLEVGLDKMDLNAAGIKRVERLEENIAKIKHR